MPALVDAESLPTDKFGYRIYGVMLHLPETQAAHVRRFHELLGADDLATKPHCSIDNFWGPDDLDAVRSALAKVISACAQVTTEVDPDDLRVADWGCAYGLRLTPELNRLQESVKHATIPLTKRIYTGDTPYWPHTTLVLAAKPHERPLMQKFTNKIDMSGEMAFESVELISRTGPSRGGKYEILGSWKLAKSQAPSADLAPQGE